MAEQTETASLATLDIFLKVLYESCCCWKAGKKHPGLPQAINREFRNLDRQNKAKKSALRLHSHRGTDLENFILRSAWNHQLTKAEVMKSISSTSRKRTFRTI